MRPSRESPGDPLLPWADANSPHLRELDGRKRSRGRGASRSRRSARLPSYRTWHSFYLDHMVRYAVPLDTSLNEMQD